MRRMLITTGVLGGGTALTFAAAVLAASLFPNGAMVQSSGWASDGVRFERVPVAVPAPGIFEPGVRDGSWTPADAGVDVFVTDDVR